MESKYIFTSLPSLPAYGKEITIPEPVRNVMLRAASLVQLNSLGRLCPNADIASGLIAAANLNK